MQTVVDTVDASTTYIGEAVVGSATDSPNWSIKKVSVNGTVTNVQYPARSDGKITDEALFIWDDRATYTYGFNS